MKTLPLLACLLLASLTTASAKADGLNQFTEVSFTSINGPGTLDIDRFVVSGSKVVAAGEMTLSDDPELGPFGWGWYVRLAPTTNGVALLLTAIGRLTDPVTIEFTYGVSPEQDAAIGALRADAADPTTPPSTIAAHLNTLRELYH